jgi:hypothetical protein
MRPHLAGDCRAVISPQRSTMSASNDPQKILLYVMPDKGTGGPPGHKFMAMRRTVKNSKGRYVTGSQFDAVGLLWPTSGWTTRDELAARIGRAILDEAGV